MEWEQRLRSRSCQGAEHLAMGTGGVELDQPVAPAAQREMSRSSQSPGLPTCGLPRLVSSQNWSERGFPEPRLAQFMTNRSTHCRIPSGLRSLKFAQATLLFYLRNVSSFALQFLTEHESDAGATDALGEAAANAKAVFTVSDSPDETPRQPWGLFGKWTVG